MYSVRPQTAQYSPRSKLAAIFNPYGDRTHDAFYNAPSPRGAGLSPRAGLTAPPRPMSARPAAFGMSTMDPRMMSPRGMSPRSMSPRNMGVEASAKLTDWVVRQAEMREMLSSAQGKTFVQVQHKREKQKVEARAEKQRKAAAEREAVIQALLQQREKEERKAARIVAKREAALRAQQRPMSAMSERPMSPRSTMSAPQIPDSELRRVHVLVKHALNGRYGGQMRQTFRALDKDGSGKISPDEVVQALLDLNLDVPTHLLVHLVNVCDQDRDGEIDYAEFAKILSTDDIVSIKVAGAAEQGLVVKAPPKVYKDGITVDEMVRAQSKLKEWFCEENGRFRRVFRAMDDDHNGYVDRMELRTLTTRTNTAHIIRPQVQELLIDLMDLDNDGRILYNEFVKVVMADDVTEFFR